MEDNAIDPAPSSEFQSAEALTGPPQVFCPNCGQPVDPSTADGPVLQCPKCGTQFFPPALEEDADESEDEKEEKDAESELSELRIRQLITLRRTAYRTRSYLIVGALGCLGFSIQLATIVFHHARESHHVSLASDCMILFMMAGLIGAFKFGARVIEVQMGINADLRARRLEEEEAARHVPDMSTLSDGSQHALNLARMFEKDRPAKDESAENPSANPAQ